MSYGTQKKKVVFEDTDHRHAQLRLRLRYDGLTQVQFFHSIITGYLEKDNRIMEYIYDQKCKIKRFGRKRLSSSQKLLDEGSQLAEKYGLSSSDKEKLFDLIAEEVGDL